MTLKKVSAFLLAAAMLTGCSSGSSTASTGGSATAAASAAATEETANAKAAPAATGNKTIDDLKIEFVPSKDADVIITGTAGLDQLLIDAMKTEGYDIGKVDITVGTTYEATGEALSAGSIDVGWLPGGTYAHPAHKMRQRGECLQHPAVPARSHFIQKNREDRPRRREQNTHSRHREGIP